MRARPGTKLFALAMAQKSNKPVAPNKYRAIRTPDATGRVHPSKLQARVADQLRLGAHAVIDEVSMPLSERPADRIRIDFLVIHEVNPDGTFRGEFVEAKGQDLGEGKQKRRRFEDRNRVPIRVIRRA